MDINTALENMRRYAGRAVAAADSDGEGDGQRLAVEMAEQWQAIDQWLSSGGFLPTAWQR